MSESTVAWQKGCRYHYTSLVHLWSEWHREYSATRLPRLMVKYEDLLFDGPNTVGALCDCFGGKRRPHFQMPLGPAKRGAGHQGSSNLSIAIQSSNSTHRLDGLGSADVEYFGAHADGAILHQFRYTVPSMDESQNVLLAHESFLVGERIARRAAPLSLTTLTTLSAFNATRLSRVPAAQGTPVSVTAGDGKERSALHIISSLASAQPAATAMGDDGWAHTAAHRRQILTCRRQRPTAQPTQRQQQQPAGAPLARRQNCLGEGFVPFDVSVPHPYGRPDGGLWGWDANVVHQEVRVTVMSRVLCNLRQNNINMSTYADVRRGSLLSWAKAGQLLDTSDFITTFEKLLPWEEDRAQVSFVCHHYSANGSLIWQQKAIPYVARVHPWSIRCPLPRQFAAPDAISLSLSVPRLRTASSTVQVLHTARLRVCPAYSSSEVYPGVARSAVVGNVGVVSSEHAIESSTFDKGTTRSAASQGQRYLSICATVGVSQGDLLDEWMAHHLALGVEHYFLFNLGGDSVASAIRPWVARGVATMVQWPYKGCSVHASGRKLWNVPTGVQKDRTVLHSFQRIEQWGALETCYQRFHPTTTWMLSIDIDEYLAPARTVHDASGNTSSAAEASAVATTTSPRGVIAALLDSHDSPVDVVSLQVLRMLRCPELSGGGCLSGAPSNSSLFGCHNTADQFFPYFQSKLFMRTSTVARFRIHYAIEPELKNLRQYFAPPANVVLLHFKGYGSAYGESMYESRAQRTGRQNTCAGRPIRRSIRPGSYLTATRRANQAARAAPDLQQSRIVSTYIAPLLQTTSPVQHSSPQPALAVQPLPSVAAAASPASRVGEFQWAPAVGRHHTVGDAIFSLAFDMQQVNFNVFLRSLRQSGYEADVVLAMGDHDAMPDVLRDDSRAVIYQTAWECSSKAGRRVARSRPSDLCVSTRLYGHPKNDPRPPRQRAMVRFEVYASWLSQYSEGSRIFLLDFRDVYFQSDPFAHLPPPAVSTAASDGMNGKMTATAAQHHSTRPWLHLFAEHAPISSSTYNSRWISSCYGKGALTAAIANSPIICSGTTAGTVEALRMYLKVMLDQYDATHCTLHGSDQGFHEYAFYTGRLQRSNVSTVLVAAGAAVVQNIAGLRARKVSSTGDLVEHPLVRKFMAEETRVVLADGSLAPIVHQYDRFPRVKAYALAQWGGRRAPLRQVATARGHANHGIGRRGTGMIGARLQKDTNASSKDVLTGRVALDNRVVLMSTAAEVALARISAEFGGAAGDAMLDATIRSTPVAAEVLGQRLARAVRLASLSAPLVYGIGGYSVTVGRGVLGSESWPAVLSSMLAPVFSAGSVPFVLRNAASGGTASLPFGWCLKALLGKPALVSWQYTMNEAGDRCNRAAEYYVRNVLQLPSHPLILLVDESPQRLRALTAQYARWGAHGINTRSALPRNSSSMLPWGVTVSELMSQDTPSTVTAGSAGHGCHAAKHHPGVRYHRFVAAAIARHHLLQLRKALQRSEAMNKSTPPMPALACSGEPPSPSRSLATAATRHSTDASTCVLVRTVAPPAQFSSCRTLVQPRFGRSEASDLLTLVRGNVLKMIGNTFEPPQGEAWPPHRWAATISPADVLAVRKNIKCGYADRKYSLVGSQVAGWLHLAVRSPRASTTGGGWPGKVSTHRFCKGRYMRSISARSRSTDIINTNQSRGLNGSAAALLVCSSSILDSRPVAAFGGLMHRSLAPLSTAQPHVEWMLDGSPATPLTVFDERDVGLATYNQRPLCVAFAMAADTSERRHLDVQLRLRVTRPGVFVTVSHVLWS